MSGKVKCFLAIAVIIVVAIVNFELVFKIYKYISMVSFIPLCYFVFHATQSK